MINRRNLITGLITFAVTAPAIVRASSLMKVKAFELPDLRMRMLSEYVLTDGPFPLDISWCRFSYDETGKIFKREWIKNENIYISEHGNVTIK